MKKGNDLVDCLEIGLVNANTQLNSLVNYLEKYITFDLNTSEFDKLLYNYVCNARNNIHDAIKIYQTQNDSTNI